MNHRPFEDWLLEDLPLSLQQRRELEAHIRGCASCAAIAESNLALHSVRQVAPAAGFTDRFRVRLAARQREQRWRHIVGMTTLVIGSLALLYWLAWPVFLAAAQSPATWITAVVGYLLFILTSLQGLSEATSILLRVLPRFVSPAGWLGITVAAAGFAALWTVSIRRAARIPQGV